MRNIVYISCFSLLFLLASFTPVGKTNYKIRRVVIDAGHGGKDPGTHGVISQEKEVALAIALELGEIIKKKGVKKEQGQPPMPGMPRSITDR